MPIKISEFPVQIALASVVLEGIVCASDEAQRLVIFAHGSGSSRHSPRNIYVARVLQEYGIATLLFDLLSEREDEVYENRFDIDLLTKRLVDVTRWAQNYSKTKDMSIGYFGASTGAAAALKAAARLGTKIRAVVSRGGRPDLAGTEELRQTKSPTLLIVGGNDDVVLELNENAYHKLHGIKELAIVPGATHLFEEPGTLEEAARLAAGWFVKYLPVAT